MNTASGRKVSPWSTHAPALAAWTDRHLVNRHDAYGHYIGVEHREDPDQTAYTDKRPLTLEVLQTHFEGRSTGDIVGLHSTARDEAKGDGETAACWSRWLAVDIDRHDDSVDPETTLRAGLAWYAIAVGLRFRVLLFDSNGSGGYHLLLVFDGPVSTERVFAFGKWLTRDWKALGLSEAPEIFPKQESIKAGGYGNWLRLPGRHHTRDHFSLVWNGSAWLGGTAAVKAIVGTVGVSADLIPAEALTPPTPIRPKRDKAARELADDARLAKDALGYLDPGCGYDQWLEIGMSLTPLGDEGLRLWDEWSEGSEGEYREGFCDRKWRSFNRTGGRTLGSLFHLAKHRGWAGPPRSNGKVQNNGTSNGHPGTRAVTPGATPVGEGETPEGDVKPDGHPGERGGKREDLPRFSNWTWEEKVTDEGEVKFVKKPMSIVEIEESLRRLSGPWPRRVVETLFCETRDHEPIYLSSSARLLAWTSRLAQVDWTKGARFVTQEQFYEHLRMTAERYEAIESIPHWPPIAGIYYMHRPMPRPSGKLDGFLDFFTPATDEDRELIRAFVLTMFWGGMPGRRPAVLVTGPDHDPESGRGVGKTTLLEVVFDELAGGSIDVSPMADMNVVKTRLLSPGACRIRAAKIDNIKTLKLSWADLEGLITSASISGRALWEGEGTRPNTLVWGLTLNGASLSKDMAQRCTVIKVGRPVFAADWEEKVRNYAKEHRWEIIADVGEILTSEAGPLTPKTRWAAWEQGVLSKVDLAERCQELVRERMMTADADDEEKEIVAEHFREMLSLHHHDAEGGKVFFPTGLAAEWLAVATRENRSPSRANSYLAGLGIPELRRSAKDGTRGWLWTGPNARSGDATFWYDHRGAKGADF